MTPRPKIPTALLASAIWLAGLVPSSVVAWSPETHAEIARQAVTISPPDLFRQIQRNENAFSAGLNAALAGRAHNDGGDALLSRLASGARATVAAIESHRPFAQIVRDLGRLAVYAAEANNPLEHSSADPSEPGYGGDYEAYVASAYPRFPVVFYGHGRDVETATSLGRLLERIERRGQELYPLIGHEYRRIGTIDGIGRFDDKSTAFGVASVSFSHAVSDLAAIYRYVWLEAGGADPRRLPITRPIGPDAEAGGGTRSPRGKRSR